MGRDNCSGLRIAFFDKIAQTPLNLDVPLIAGQDRELEELKYKDEALR